MKQSKALKMSLLCNFVCVCGCVDSPGDTQHHHTDDGHLQGSDDGSDEDVTDFSRTRHHIQHVVLLGVTLWAAEA